MEVSSANLRAKFRSDRMKLYPCVLCAENVLGSLEFSLRFPFAFELRFIFPSFVFERIPPRHHRALQTGGNMKKTKEWEIQINREDRSEEETAQDGK